MEKLFLNLSAVFFLGAPLFAQAAHASAPTDMTCVAEARGYLPYNKKTGVLIGAGYIFEKGVCNKAVDTYRPDIGSGTVCSWTGWGWSPHDALTGMAISGSAYWYDLSTCQNALAMARWNILCAPRESGSGIFDVANGFFVGRGYYFDINVCTEASSTALKEKVCAPKDGYTAIFNRRYNEPMNSELYLTSVQCGRELTREELP